MKKANQKIFRVVLLTAAVTCAVTATFAWFITNTEISFSSGKNFEVEVGNNLSVSRLKEDGSTWTEYGGNLNMNISSKLTDITGNGTSFQTAISIDKSTNDVLYPMAEVVNSDHLGYFYDINLKVKSNFPCSLYLAEGSYIKPLSSLDTESEANARISLNDYSADYIAGAFRVALLRDTCDENLIKTGEELVQVWIPNDKYQTVFYNGLPSEFLLNGIREEKYGYQRNAKDGSHEIEYVEYKDSDYLANKVVVGNKGVLADSAKQLAKQSLPIITFENSDVEVEKRFTLRIWIEGSDRESNDTTNLGRVDYKFKFISLGKSDNDITADNELDKISCVTKTVNINNEDKVVYVLKNGTTEITSNANIEYSFNGIDWYKYENYLVFPIKKSLKFTTNGYVVRDILTNEPIFDEETEIKSSVYIKNGETIALLHSKYRSISIPVSGGE